MLHYIDHKDRQGRPRTACGQLAQHMWTPTYWDRAAFIAWPLKATSGPADRCPQCLRAARGTKHSTPRTFDEYSGLWAAKLWDFGLMRDTWTRLYSPVFCTGPYNVATPKPGA